MTVQLQIEEQEIWQRLQQTNKPIVLYGMGNGALKILQVMQQKDIPVTGIFASDQFVRGHFFEGFRVMSYHECCERFGDFIVLVAFASELPEVMHSVFTIGMEQELYIPDVPVVGGGLFDLAYYSSHYEELNRVYSLLSDECSRQVFENVLRFKISGRPQYLFMAQNEKREAYCDILKVSLSERYLDLGAYDGDTVRELLTFTGGEFEYIIAVEPDPKNFRKLERKMKDFDRDKIELLRVGIWDKPGEINFSAKAGRNSCIGTDGDKTIEAESIDHLLENRRITLIKMDVEGAESRAIAGAGRTIAEQHPKLMVSIYHRNEDLFQLPLQIHALYPAYRFYIRRFPCFPAWNLNLYAVADG